MILWNNIKCSTLFAWIFVEEWQDIFFKSISSLRKKFLQQIVTSHRHSAISVDKKLSNDFS